MEHITENIQLVRQRIANAATAAGRQPDEVKLVAVSKTFPADAVRAAYACGQRLFGENRVQELAEKAAALPADIEWHLIGHLQGNKAANAVQCATYIHSIDSEKLLRRVDRIAGELGRRPRILLEINISGEKSKFGSGLEHASELAAAAAACANLELCGLMTMAPFDADEAELRTTFGGLRQLRDKLEQELEISLPELSMGMSSDFETAIREGTTLVRIGAAVFGKRSCKL